MCGIAGYSLGNGSRVNRTLAAQALLAGIAERGADAAGYAFRRDDELVVRKQRTGASALIDSIALPQPTGEVLVHVRDFTKGHPTILANNHPVRHGRVVGIHNGIIANDDELFARHGLLREEPEMSVDSEAIFALAAHSQNDPRSLEAIGGSMATAWLDEREPGTVFVARGVGRPLWLGKGRDEVFFASTRAALEIASEYTGVRLRMSELRDGTFLALRDGRVARNCRFRPDRSYVEESALPAVRAPGQSAYCLARLAVIAAAAA